ncbi:MAG: four helix bundle protein [Eubacterium sp.]|nr:four helix bundle protein [Eubacterium sp.]
MDSIVEGKAFDFAKRIVKLYNYLTDEKKEYTMSKQLLRSGTSIGANIAEAQCAQSKNDFVSKIYIALKEANETKYWLRLLHDMEYISDIEFSSIFNDCCEIYKMLSSIIITSKKDD